MKSVESIDLIQSTAVEAAGKRQLRASDLPTAVILDSAQSVHSLESYLATRFRYRGSLVTTSLVDFAAYTKLASGSPKAVGFVDVAKMAANVFFNLGTSEQPGHGDWTATLNMQPTAAYKALADAQGKRFDQAGLIDWLEDWNDVLKADFADGNASLTRAVASIRKMKISTKAETTHNTNDFSASRSALEEVEATGADALPTGFTLSTSPYEGLQSREFALKLSVLTGSDKPALTLRWLRKEQQLEDIAREFKQVLGDALGDSATLTIGSFYLGK